MSAPAALLVEGEDDRGALAACRALARAGWRVGTASGPGGLAASSRSVSHRFALTPPQVDLERFAADVEAAVRSGGYEVVFSGGGDAEAMALSLTRDWISATIPYPPHDRLVRALDKLDLADAAAAAGLGAPRTVEATAAALTAAEPPFVIKARLHTPRLGHEGPCRLATTITSDRRAARNAADAMRDTGGQPVLQEAIQGGLIAFSCIVAEDGAIIARSQQRAERIWPPDAGVSSRAVTTAVDPALERDIGRLLAGLGWQGAAELQFLVPADGRPRLIDLNGRFYGSLSLAVAAGANLPAVWAAAATGRELPAERDARPGVRYQWLESDIRRALRERHGGLLTDLGATLAAALPPTTHSIASLRDPRPLAHAVGSLTRRARGRLGRNVR